MEDRPSSEEPSVDVPPEASEGDLAEQARPWSGDDEDANALPKDLPDDAPEADVLEQARPVSLDEEDHDR